MTTDLRDLLHGPRAIFDHDEYGDGLIQSLGGLYHLAMLKRLSTVVREQCTASIYKEPIHLQITGGNSLALTNALNWMQTSCQNGQLVPFYTVITSPVSYLLGLSAVRQFGITALEPEINEAAERLSSELLTFDHLEQTLINRRDILPEIRSAIAGIIAQYFVSQRLPNVRRYFDLATTYPMFDQDVSSAIRRLRGGSWLASATDAELAWMRRDRHYGTNKGFAGGIGQIPMPIDDPVAVRGQTPAYMAQPAPLAYQIPPLSTSTGHVLPFRSSPDNSHSPISIRINLRAESNNNSQGHEYGTPHCGNLQNRSTHRGTGGGCFHANGHGNLVGVARECHCPVSNLNQTTFSDIPSYEAPRPGETLKERRRIRSGHYIHIFQDAFGNRRVVNKDHDFRYEGTDTKVKYGCGCWLDRAARSCAAEDGVYRRLGLRSLCHTCTHHGRRNGWTRCG